MHSLVDSYMCPDQRSNPKPWYIGMKIPIFIQLSYQLSYPARAESLFKRKGLTGLRARSPSKPPAAWLGRVDNVSVAQFLFVRKGGERCDYSESIYISYRQRGWE